MHREYDPADMHHLAAHAFQEDEGHAHAESHRPLYVLTAVIGVLIGADIALAALGLETWRSPLGISWATIAALLGGARIVYGALEALLGGKVGADVALAQACIAALAIGRPFVAAEVVFIALLGEVLEAVTADRALRSIRRLFDQSPKTARVRRDGAEIEIPAHRVVVGDTAIVRPGERIPVDGAVILGRSAVDQAALTGESAAVDKGVGDAVYTGTMNQFGMLEIRAERVGHETTLGQVFRLVAEAQKRKAPLHRTADRLARYFLPLVETVAALTLLAGYLRGWPDTWTRAVAVLVVACPCALILATPAAILASMAWLARHGVVLKGGAALERLASCDTFAFDKTGTLTLGRPELADVVPLPPYDAEELLQIVATAERPSEHPIAKLIAGEAGRRGLILTEVEEFHAHPGTGVAARVRDEGGVWEILVGNARLFRERGVVIPEEAEAALQSLDDAGQTSMLAAVDGRVAGLIGIRDAVRREAHDVIHDLKHLKIREIAILTGDRPAAARAVAKRVHVQLVEAEMLPADKAAWVRERQAAGRRVAMVGDGINDAPALAAADVGIALGGIGSDLAAEAGDVVLLGDPLRVLPDLVGLSRATVAVIRQNILIFAFGLNALAMGSAVLGLLGPVAAAILHQVGSLLVLLNAMRLLAYGDWANFAPVRGLRAFGNAVHRLDDRLDPGLVAARLAARWRVLAVASLLFALGMVATSGWVAIGPGEVGLLRRFGRFAGTLEPGLHLRWPAPIERVTRLEPGRVRGVTIGFRAGEADPGTGAVRWEAEHGRGPVARRDDESLLLTGDGQLVELAATVQYHLDPEALGRFAFETADADAAVRPLAESAVREVAARRTLGDLLTGRRRQAEADALADLKRRVERYRLGLIVTAVAFQDVHPPLAVVDAFRDVSRAESEKQRRGVEGRTILAGRLAEARGLAAAAVHAAEADRLGRSTRAGGEADAFGDRLRARCTAPDLADRRLYWESIASALSGRPKVILDPDRAGGHVRLMLLPETPTAEALKAATRPIPARTP